MIMEVFNDFEICDTRNGDLYVSNSESNQLSMGL
jgi:hypothetical protein